MLIFYEDQYSRFCYVVMKKDIAACEKFQNVLEEKKYYDLETPYGYGGPLNDEEICVESQIAFGKEMQEFCIKNNIVSQFVRFHPLLENDKSLSQVIETRYLRETIFMDTTSPAIIMEKMDSKNRNMVRKAAKNGVIILRESIDNYADFIPMYVETMAKNGADEYYTFNKDYFESLKLLKDNACIFYAIVDEMPVSGAIMYYNENYMHYHLSGTYSEYRKYSPGNLLLYEAACWASERGIKKFHLGGGVAADDSLFGFKKQFNKNERAKFVVGRTIFDREKYNELLEIRQKLNLEFDVNNGFMIQYRR